MMSHVAELQSFLETKIIDLALSTSQDTYPHLSCGGEVKNLVDNLDRFEKEAAISISPINLSNQVAKQEKNKGKTTSARLEMNSLALSQMTESVISLVFFSASLLTLN